MRHTLHPTSHDTNLCMEMVYLLYCILECKPIDVGRLVCASVKASIDRANGRLPYPSFIHKLMEQAKVPTLDIYTFSRERTSHRQANLVEVDETQ